MGIRLLSNLIKRRQRIKINPHSSNQKSIKISRQILWVLLLSRNFLLRLDYQYTCRKSFKICFRAIPEVNASALCFVLIRVVVACLKAISLYISKLNALIPIVFKTGWCKIRFGENHKNFPVFMK